MRVLGFPIESPQTVVNRLLSDVGAVARVARSAPAQFDRLLELGEQMTELGRKMVDIAERLDRRAAAMMTLGERLDARAVALLELGGSIRDVGERVDAAGAEIVDSASHVVATGSDLITVLPTLERALDMATPLEGAIDRIGRLVDRLPGGPSRARSLPTRADQPADAGQTPRTGQPPHTGQPAQPGQPESAPGTSVSES